MTPEEQNLDMLVAELDRENRLLRARNERLEKEAEQRAANQLDDINVVDMPAQQEPTRLQCTTCGTVYADGVPPQALAQPQQQLQTCNCRWDGDAQVQQCTLHEAHVDAIHEWAERAKTAEHQFKNFHRLLCERFSYSHDEREWKRDQLSLIEWIAKQAQPQQEPVAWRPDVCPITGLPFFMWIEHHETGQNVPTYGGPYDSYTIPVRDKDGSYYRERYDHDLGGWLTDEVEDVGVQIVSDQAYVSDEPPASKPWVELTDVEIARVVSLAGFAPDWAEAEIATQIVRTLAQQLREKNQ